jgi:hypothetical protein
MKERLEASTVKTATNPQKSLGTIAVSFLTEIVYRRYRQRV